jgi:hypothetical protein
MFLLLYKVFLGTSLAGSLAWVIYYFRIGVHSVLGKNLLIKTLIICGLLAISLLASMFRLNPAVLRALTWVDLALIASIGPVMVWRFAAFRQMNAAAAVECPNGHFVSADAMFCPRCGVSLALPARAEDPTPPEGIPSLPAD